MVDFKEYQDIWKPCPDCTVVVVVILINKDSFLVLHQGTQGAKKVIFKACHSGKLKLAYTSSNVISTSPKNILMRRIDFTVLL